MTDLYGVRVLSLDEQRRRARLRVVVLYYDTEAPYDCLPDDPSFFLRVLHNGRLGELVTTEEIHDESWVDANTRWFIESVERVATRNHPFMDEHYDRLIEAGGGRRGEGWSNEHLRAQADYDVVVTDPQWIEHLSSGDEWRDACYATVADFPRPGEHAFLPDLSEAAAVLKPFKSTEPSQLAFSDDGRYLAITGAWGPFAVVDTADWSERVRGDRDDYLSPTLMWVPGRHVITLRHAEELLPQLAFDAVTGEPVEAPAQVGNVRSPRGRHRALLTVEPSVRLVSESGDDRVVPVGPADADSWVEVYATVSFSADDSLMAAAVRDTSVAYVLDPTDGRTVATIENGANIQSMRLSPDGAFLAISARSCSWLEVTIRRVADQGLVARRRMARRQYPRQDLPFAWSPDGRWFAVNVPTSDERGETHVFPIGMPAEPPARFAPGTRPDKRSAAH